MKGITQRQTAHCRTHAQQNQTTRSGMSNEGKKNISEVSLTSSLNLSISRYLPY
jgi:hypothetical protein